MMKASIDKAALAKALRAESDSRTVAQARLIGRAAGALSAFTINEGANDLKVDRAASFEQYRGMMREPENVEWLVNGKFDPADYCIEHEKGVWCHWHFHEVMEEVRKCIMLGRWDAEHGDDVDEQQRRINYNNREAFYELTVRQMAIEFKGHWANDTLSAVAVDSLYCAGLLDGVTVSKVGEWAYQPRNMSATAVGLVERFIERAEGKNWCFSAEAPIGLLLVAAADTYESMKQDADLDSKTVIVDGFDINLTPKPDVQWLVEGVIPKTVDPDSPYVGFLYGNSGTYKSFIATGICAAIARGADGAAGFAGLAKVKGAPGKVMYLSGEDSYGIRIRFEAEAGGIVPDCVRMNLNELDSVFSEDGNFDPAIVRCVIDHEPDLIVMDTMNSLKLCDNNNSSASVSKMMHKLKELGTTVMVIHHTTKSGDSMEGSHAMTSNADFIMRTDIVEREDDIPVVDLSCGKLKNAAKFKPMRIELVEQGEALVCRNHSSYEEAREAEMDKIGIDGLILKMIAGSGERGVTVTDILESEDVKYKGDKRSLSRRINRKMSKSDDKWNLVVKVNNPGCELRYAITREPQY